MKTIIGKELEDCDYLSLLLLNPFVSIGLGSKRRTVFSSTNGPNIKHSSFFQFPKVSSKSHISQLLLSLYLNVCTLQTRRKE